MEVLNLAGLKPVSVHKPTIVCERRTEPRKLVTCSSISPSKFSKPLNFETCTNIAEVLSKSFVVGGSLILSSILNDGLAEALTYEEALEQLVGTFTSGDSASFDVGSFVDSAVKFGTQNPVAIIGGVAVLAVPLILSQLLQKSKPWGVETATSAYSKLSEDGDAQLLDIRNLQDIREVGSPDIRGLKKRPVSITFKGDESAFLKKVLLKFKAPENTSLFILDKFDGSSAKIAELVTANGFKAAFAIKDGAEGTRGWMNSKLPWLPPRKTLNVDFSDLKDAIDSALGGDLDVLPVTLGVAAATGLGALAFTEIETILQLLGSAALIQLVANKLLFAENRKATFQQIDEFLNTKVAPKELVDEIKLIGKALLPASEWQSSDSSNTVEVQKIDDVSQVNTAQEIVTESKVEAAVEVPPMINSVPKPDIVAVEFPGLPRPLSPYSNYPDFKPPTSPSPSKP